MAQRHKPEEIVIKLLQVEVLVSQGSSVADAIRSIEVTQITYYRWGQDYPLGKRLCRKFQRPFTG